MEFFEVIKSRRSIRKFLPQAVPAEVIEKALEAALLAPNSSNMQTWEFYWIKDEVKKQKAVQACLSQSAAQTASELVVAVADPSKWKLHAKEMVHILEQKKAHRSMINYYSKLIPFIYGKQWMAPIKWIIFNIAGIFKPTPRSPWSYRDRDEVCIKSCALGCENFMLAMSAQDYDTCPIEGFDQRRLRKILKLPFTARIVMAIAVGKRAPEGVWGDQIRFPKDRFIKII